MAHQPACNFQLQQGKLHAGSAFTGLADQFVYRDGGGGEQAGHIGRLRALQPLLALACGVGTWAAWAGVTSLMQVI